MINLKQSTVNFFSLNVKELAVDEFYMLELISDVTGKKYRCFPTIVASNSRYTKFALEITFEALSSPLEGVIVLNPPGSWKYNVYKTTELDLSNTALLVNSGIAILEASCVEIEEEIYTSDNENGIFINFESEDEVVSFVSDNENSEGITFNSVQEIATFLSDETEASVFTVNCLDACLAWSTSSFWNLVEDNWDCSLECSTFSNDSDEFDDDIQFFIECTN